MNERTTDGRQIVYLPQLDTTTGIVSVCLADDETVEFHWWHKVGMPSQITGYTIKRINHDKRNKTY